MVATVDVVIVNWNSGSQIVGCINSIIDFGKGLVKKIIVVDNGSTDGSMGLLTQCDERIKTVFAGKNLGFARACNLGASYATSKYFLFFNPDAMFKAGTIERVMAFMESEDGRDVGICGVKIVGDNGHVSKGCARFPTFRTWLGKSLFLDRLFPRVFPSHFMSDFDHLTSCYVDQVIGAFYFIRSSLFLDLGGYDERFFVYFEDLDLSLRVKRAGYRSYYLADAVIYHKGGGVSEKVKAHRLFYSLRSRFLYCFKHFTNAEAWFVVFFAFLPELFARITRSFLRVSPQEFFDTVKAYYWLFLDFPKVLKVAFKQ